MIVWIWYYGALLAGEKMWTSVPDDPDGNVIGYAAVVLTRAFKSSQL